MESLLIVGSGLAGLSAARAARKLGLTGPVTVLGQEAHRPYDRPPLSKDYLAGTTARAELDLQPVDDDLDVHWVRDPAVRLDLAGRAVTTAGGQTYAADAVVLATGAVARRMAELEEGAPDNVLTLRTVEDADRLRATLTPGARVVIVGAGLIGSEVGSTAAALGCRVTVLDREPEPLARLYGADLAPRLAALADRSGVRVLTDVTIGSVEVSPGEVGAGEIGAGRLRALTLADGRRLPVDVLLVSVGAEPEIGWLADSGLDLDDGVVCDSAGRVSAGGDTVDGVVAVGDCAAWWDHHLRRNHRAQHWTDALERPGRAVAALLGVDPPRRRPYLPYFWSDQHGVQIQMAGYASLADDVHVELDDPDSGRLVAVYRRAGEPVAVLAVSSPREFVRWRKALVGALGHVLDVTTRPSHLAAPAAGGPAPSAADW